MWLFMRNIGMRQRFKSIRDAAPHGCWFPICEKTWFDQHTTRGLEQNQQIKGSQSAWGVLQSAANLGFPEQVPYIFGFYFWLFWENYMKPTKLYVLALEALKCFGLRVQGWPLDSLGRAQAYDWGKVESASAHSTTRIPNISCESGIQLTQFT